MNRNARKMEKLKARGTYRRSRQWKLDENWKRVVESAGRLAWHLGCTTEELLVEVGAKKSA